ncbi:B3 domain-containing protein At2g32645-like [Vicia villosa]|uniref:B3 domain-containing protein At2g32645-like n=1 Tax=Vicia villosa TaxID=3911 RepID=UPI00273C845F|nr:B3 domain-containing protein At2g32645-like [Vicia villosa]
MQSNDDVWDCKKCDGVGRISIKIGRSDQSLRVDFRNQDIRNNKVTLEQLSFIENYKTRIKKRKTKNAKSRKTSKKQKNDAEEEKPDLPLAFKEMIEHMEGRDVKLVIQKQLTKSDLTQNNGRLSIPKARVIESFLTTYEKSYLDYERNRKGEKKDKIPSMIVSMLDPNLNLWEDLCLKKWKMETTEIYNIACGWNDLVKDNKWKKDQKIKVQLWSFRRNFKLHFALVKL